MPWAKRPRTSIHKHTSHCLRTRLPCISYTGIQILSNYKLNVVSTILRSGAPVLTPGREGVTTEVVCAFTVGWWLHSQELHEQLSSPFIASQQETDNCKQSFSPSVYLHVYFPVHTHYRCRGLTHLHHTCACDCKLCNAARV